MAISEVFGTMTPEFNPAINLLTVMVLIWTVGVLFRKIHQPPVLGELLAGILFGPCCLGIIHADETLKVLADLGVFFLMFYAGIQTNPFDLKRMGGASSLVGAFGFLAPFGAGYLACRQLFGMITIESLFMALALSLTAIAVNARILDDLGLYRCRIAPVIIGASLVDDVLSLACFSAIVALAQGSSGGWEAMLATLVKVFVFFGLSTVIGLQVYPRLSAYFSSREAKGFTFSLIVALFFGIMAEFSGLHIIIGAYMAGLFVREGIVNHELLQKIEDRIVSITYGFLGPVFFVSLSFHMRFDIFADNLWLVTVLLLTATVSKVAGSFAGSGLGGMNGTESAVVAFLTTMFPSLTISFLLKRKGRQDLLPMPGQEPALHETPL